MAATLGCQPFNDSEHGTFCGWNVHAARRNRDLFYQSNPNGTVFLPSGGKQQSGVGNLQHYEQSSQRGHLRDRYARSLFDRQCLYHPMDGPGASAIHGALLVRSEQRRRCPCVGERPANPQQVAKPGCHEKREQSDQSYCGGLLRYQGRIPQPQWQCRGAPLLV